jgi:transposase
MFFESKGLRVFVYSEEIDMRCGFERLHSLCVHQMRAQMNQGHVYLFFGKNRRRLKILSYDGTGLVLIAKRIEGGGFMRHEELLARAELSLQELKLIFHGSRIRHPVVDRSLPAFMPQREPFALPTGGVQNHL